MLHAAAHALEESNPRKEGGRALRRRERWRNEQLRQENGGVHPEGGFGFHQAGMSHQGGTHAIRPIVCGVCGVDDEEVESLDGVDGSSRRLMQNIIDPILPKRAEGDEAWCVKAPLGH